MDNTVVTTQNITLTTESPYPFILPNLECNPAGDQEFYILTSMEAYSLIASACIIVCLMMLEKRTSTACSCVGQRPGIVFPVNLLDHGCDNFGYAMAFGSVTSYCFKLFFNDGNIFDNGPGWSKTLYVMLYVLSYGLMFYPLFACLTTTWVFIGSFLGLGYTGLWIYWNLRTLILCSDLSQNDENLLPGRDIAVQIPVLFCLICLFVRYGFLIVLHVKHIVKERTLRKVVTQHEREHLGTRYNVAYVKELLVPRCGLNGPQEISQPEVNPSLRKKIRILIRRYVYQNDPTFKYSPRIICIFTVALICAYQFGILIILGVYQLQKFVPQLYPAPENKSAHSNTTDDDKENASTLYQLRLLIRVLNGSMMFSFAVSSLMTFFATFRILTEYRRQIKMMYKGNFSSLPFRRDSRHPQFIMSDNISYAGSQVAYTLWGYVIVFLALTCVCMIVMYLIVLPILGKVSKIFLKSFWNLLSGFAVLQAVKIGQTLMSRGFLQHRTSQDERGKVLSTPVLALNNRKVYHNVSYFLFFFYIVLGVFGCLVTILKGVLLGIVYLARLDKCGLVSGFETWDKGYMYYVSFLHLEECHRHPVLLVFCDILLDSTHKKRHFTMRNYGSADSVRDSTTGTQDTMYYINGSRRLAINRWHKAYTLIRNPKIRSKDIEEEFDRLSELDASDGIVPHLKYEESDQEDDHLLIV